MKKSTSSCLLSSTAQISHEQTTTTKRYFVLLSSLNKKTNQARNASVSSSSATITSISSQSTICNSNSTCSNSHKVPVIRAKHPVAIPDYSALRKLFLKFQSKPKHRRDILKVQVSLWFRKNCNDVCFQEPQHAKAAPLFWGLKDASKEEKRLESGRIIFLKWWRWLLNNISVATQDDKSLYCELILEIMGRNEFLEFDFIGPFHYSEWLHLQQNSMIKDYRRLIAATLRLAVDKLNQKALYSNMISFSAKVLAFVYFKVPGVAILLLQALDAPLECIYGLQKEMMNMPFQHQQQQQRFRSELKGIFPSFLHTTMASDKRSYQHCLASDEDYSELPLSKPGNWKRRWESDDSELFFSFYRSYHAIQSVYIKARYPNVSQFRLYERNLILTVSPGYMCIASYFANKLHLLTQREICSVTNGAIGTNNNSNKNSFFSSLTLSPMNNIQLINEPSNCKSGFGSVVGKPKPLVVATKRYAECMVWNTVSADPDGLYHDMANVWLRTVIKKTVLTNAEQVFCLLDIVEQAIFELQKCPVKLPWFPIDRPFILYTLSIVLSQCDHTITLLRALSFIYAHFHFLTIHAPLLDMLCNRILMNSFIFERLLLHWGKNVRIFFLRCLIWRVGRVWNAEDILWSNELAGITKETDVAGKHNICNGLQCWLRWSVYCSPSATADNAQKAQAFDQCALEIHIKLETLMVSFHKHFSNIRNKQENQPSIATIPETPMAHFTSKLILLPLCEPGIFLQAAHGHSSMKKSIPKYTCDKSPPSKLSWTVRFHKREFSRLFDSTNRSLMQRSSKHRAPYLKNCHADDEGIYTADDENTNHTSMTGEIYTVSSKCDSNFFSSPRSLQSDIHKDGNATQSSFISSVVNSWRYDDAKQVYAKKVMAELKDVVNEYSIWLQKTPNTSAELALAAPNLFLEWPKNWSFST